MGGRANLPLFRVELGVKIARVKRVKQIRKIDALLADDYTVKCQKQKDVVME